GLVKLYNITATFGVNIDVAKAAVYRALGGYDGSLVYVDSSPYGGLLSQEEMKLYGELNNKLSGVKVGKIARDNKTGIFGMSKQELHSSILKGAVASGHVIYSREELSL